MAQHTSPAVAASGRWTDTDGIRYPSGDTHAWTPGTNQTLCGVPLSRARLDRFPHVPWSDALYLAELGEHGVVPCRRCTAATRSDRPRWTRKNPRP
ncbi:MULTISPECIES: hypothetical protein [Rhodococcus]|uniref:Uncharacterized protein n=2 Tax=Rhodococcus rhodochrous TaxID=1829 RepID=A0A562ETB6_RHORH|nr:MULTISPECIES: hypothetical protein [Rhodococcus]MCD2111651.1 hypothetical protein [Rhodococcus rhodochrous]QHG81941.1 hypothetical protein D1O33_08310 [Rhodococcus rhodochrous]QOH58384.1 hypothetical protein C6Y44_22210 [Rhodococcus rhodochrous]TWH25276.1 hypothetical protein L618_000100007320 [Rhodococcus rhodochrous J45]WAL45997.1 hypothetical protein OQN32_21525 [Rhodococcus pyridinivorans]